MKETFRISEGRIVPHDGGQADVVVYAAPTEQEKRDLIESLSLDAYDLESALDPEEIARVEFAPQRLSVICKRPKNVSFDQRLRLEVSSTGLFLQPHRLTAVVPDDPITFVSKEFHGISLPAHVLLRFLWHTVHHFIAHLKIIKQITLELEEKITTSMENRYLLQMFALGESLIYYVDAIESNGSALARLRANPERAGFTKEDLDFLDDVILDNQQCARQAHIYSTVLSGLMDARGTLINNNMNVLLKNLTLINVVFLPLNLIAGVLGMSEFSAFTQGTAWWVSYGLFSLGMALLAVLTWRVLRNFDRGERFVGRRRK